LVEAPLLPHRWFATPDVPASPTWRWRFAYLPLAVSLLAHSGTLGAQCTRQPLGADGNQYGPRGSRCEGRTIVDWTTIGSKLAIVSVTGKVEEYDPEFPTDLLLFWRAPDGGAMKVEAVSARSGLHYRMDLDNAQAVVPYRWRSDIVSALQVTWSDLGILGKVQVPAIPGGNPLYVPMDLRLHGGADLDAECTSGAMITVKVVAGVPFNGAVTMYLTPVDESWVPKTRELPVPTKSFPPHSRTAGSPIELISDCLKPGAYQVDVKPPATAPSVFPARGYIYIR
jgi:hypothetical protein